MRSSILSPTSALCALALLVGTPARAELPEDEADVRARELFKAGQIAYDLARFDEALVKYAEAYELKPLPGFLFNLAQCHRQLGDDRKALFFYGRYLDLAPTSANARVAKALFTETKTRITEQEDAAKQAEVRKQELALAQAKADAARAEAQAAQKKKEALLAEQSALSQVLLKPLSESDQAPLYRRWWLWAGVGAGVVATGVGVAVLAANAAPHD